MTHDQIVGCHIATDSEGRQLFRDGEPWRDGSPLAWHRFGSWPHRVDLMLVGDGWLAIAERFDELASELLGSREATVPVAALAEYLPTKLVAEMVTIGQREGLPLLVFLSPWPDGFSVVACIVPPFTNAVLSYRDTSNPVLGDDSSIMAEILQRSGWESMCAPAPIGGAMTKISAVIPDDLGVALRARARAEDRSVGAVVRRALTQHVAAPIEPRTTTHPADEPARRRPNGGGR